VQGDVMTLDRIADEALEALRARGTLRRMRVLEGAQAARMRVGGRDVVLFAGSNYLDLSHHPLVVEAACRAARESGCAAGGSRLINGNLASHEALESELATFFDREAGLVFNTGYMANVGIIPALVGPDDVVVSDELNHASIIDGARLSRAEVRVFRHGDLADLEKQLIDVCRPATRVLLAVDGVYSMDGDLAPLHGVVTLARRYGAITLLDDAHGTGTIGPRGRGTAEHHDVLADVDILMGTLGKSLGSFGAFVVGSHKLRELLVNTARSFIFSCALAPPQVEAARAALRLIDAEPWRREALQQNAARLRHLDRRLHDADRAGHHRRQRHHDVDLRGTARARLLRPGDPTSLGQGGNGAAAHHHHGDPHRRGDRCTRRRGRPGDLRAPRIRAVGRKHRARLMGARA
jgi:8-amino-7-oxononanoate synthase